MKLQISKKLSYTICILGWLAAAVSIAFLPDSIPISFTDGVPSKFSGSFSIFMWPLGFGFKNHESGFQRLFLLWFCS